MKTFDTILGFLPPWVPFCVIGVLLVSLGGAVWAWANAREEAGMAKVSATVNAATIQIVTKQLDRNQAIAEAVDRLTSHRAETIRETIREVHVQPATTVCRDAPAMRALNGRLRYGRDSKGGGPSTARPAPAAVPAPSR